MIKLHIRRSLALLGLPCVVAIWAKPALAADKLTADLSGGAMVATNPFLSAGNDTAAESVFGEVSTDYVSTNEISTLSIHGYARVEEFLRRYSRNDAYTVDANYMRRLSERVDVRFGGSFRSNRLSPQDILFNTSGTGIPAIPDPVIVSDVSAYGRTARSTDIGLHAGAGFVLGPRAKGDVDFGISQYRSTDAGLFDYRTATQNVKYSRQISERTSIYGQANFSEVNYLGRREGDALIITPTLGVSRNLSDTIKIAIDLGASWSRVIQPNGARFSSTTFAFHGEICSERDETKICLDASRSSQPTALGRVRAISQAIASFNRTLNAKDQLRLYASYSRTGESSSDVLARPSSFVGVSADFSHQASKRLSIFASANYADLYETGVSRRANIQGRAGLRVHFGAL